MKSIRLSLVVYFLVLLTAALGAVCWFAYRTAAAALEERRQGSRDLVETQYKSHCEEVRTGLDRRLLRQAQIVATMVRPPIHVEALYTLGAGGIACTGAPHLHLGLWLREGMIGLRSGDGQLSLAEHLFRLRTTEIDIEAAEALTLRPRGTPPDMDPDSAEVLGPLPGHAQEYFQVFLGNGQPSSRSHSLGAESLPFDPQILRTPFPQEHPDTVNLQSGVTVRRVTVKSRMVLPRNKDRQAFNANPWNWLKILTPVGKGGAPVKFTVAPPQAFAPPTFGREIYIQYAIDIAPTETRLQQYADDRDRQLALVEADTANELSALRSQFLWIAIATFAATLIGGYILLVLGLAPLARLSEAVSEVTERDFRLKVEVDELPVELKPIAQRLSETLWQLGRAFDREKQAAADISHELRTPLAALMTTIEVALRKSRSAQEYREILEECHGSGQQMSQMVERLLALARLDAGADRVRPRVVDVGELAQRCADLIRPLARARALTLTTHVAATELPVKVDPDKLREVVTNLLHNAVEYNRDGGTIDLTVEGAGSELVIEVSDTGIGISPEARDRIFERFYRADPSRHADSPHAGLGLAIVKGYVDLLGGTITVESTPQVGTTFRIRLPAAVPAPARDEAIAVAVRKGD
jgi:heavy metal sensor kinase